MCLPSAHWHRRAELEEAAAHGGHLPLQAGGSALQIAIDETGDGVPVVLRFGREDQVARLFRQVADEEVVVAGG